MSPADFVGTGALANEADGRKIPANHLSFGFVVSGSVPQSKTENLRTMSNFGDLNSAFPSSDRINPTSSFDSAPFSRPSSGLSKPRLSKVRRQVKSQNLKPSGNSVSLSGLGFNPFHNPSSFMMPLSGSIAGESGFGRSTNEAFVFGNNDGERVVEEMNKLKIQGEDVCGKDYRKGVGFDDNVKDSQESMCNVGQKDSSFSFGVKNKSGFVFTGGENVSGVSGKSLEDELPNELNNKLRIHASKEAAEGRSSFTIGESENFMSKDSCSGFSSWSSGHLVQEKMKKLNIEDKVFDGGVDQKQHTAKVNEEASVFSTDKAESRDLIGEKILSDELARKLNVGNIASEGITKGHSSSEAFSNGSPKENVTEQNINDSDKSYPMNSSFAGAVPDEHLNARNVGYTTSSVNTVEFNFSSKQNSGGATFMEFKTPNSKLNPFSSLGQKLDFNAKKENSSAMKSRRTAGKQAVKVQLNVGEFAFAESGFPQGISEVSGSYSPMDISPYEKTQSEAESTVSDQSSNPEKSHLSTVDASSDMFDEELLAATERMQINEGDGVNTDQVHESHTDKGGDHEELAEGSVSGAETESFKSAAEEMEVSSDTFVTATETDVTSTLKFDREENEDHFPSSDSASSNFTFSAASSSVAHGPLPTAKRVNRKKNPSKFGHDPYNLVPNAPLPYTSFLKSSQHSPLAGVQSILSQGKPYEKDTLTHLPKPIYRSEVEKGREVENESNAAQEACEKWRSRGNHAYTNGDLSKAEEFYTRGINSVSRNETSRSCLRALMLCYSNRAATRMSLGRMREAILDCTMASSIDPNFLRVQVRAGNCYLSLGEIEDASRYFKKCLQCGSDICVDRKIFVEASEGLQKAQKVSECMHEAGRLLHLRTSHDADKVLGVLEESLSISSYSEKLLEMKGEALLMLEKYEEVVKLCELTVDLAEKNSLPLGTDRNLANLGAHDLPKDINFRIWRCRLMLKSCFYMGKLEEAIASLEKQEQLVSVTQRNDNKTLESSIPFAATVRGLLRLKTAGNEAFQSAKHTEAVEHYTAALSFNVESRPFMAVCFCNRAAAYKALGQVIDAIADCSLAIALDQNYSKVSPLTTNILWFCFHCCMISGRCTKHPVERESREGPTTRVYCRQTIPCRIFCKRFASRTRTSCPVGHNGNTLTDAPTHFNHKLHTIRLCSHRLYLDGPRCLR
ncbi:PREDICTED: uncharacterized protein LOC104799115 isoform X2 [Tarenaya hassleriana]|uniref:uncharacterized protein LOC104799115 isoform X2 n=1 Tax=Tarenaya hassleriana TaxID=28532 RepID=UPI00053C5FFC|nr:PREDICTED: uncharacterized protein LOC104799115 isoform X2 [Tarenaya hassleriana]